MPGFLTWILEIKLGVEGSCSLDSLGSLSSPFFMFLMEIKQLGGTTEASLEPCA